MLPLSLHRLTEKNMKFKSYAVPKQLIDVVDYIYLNEHDNKNDYNLALPNPRMCLVFTYNLDGTLFEQNMATNIKVKSHEIAIGGFISQSMKYITTKKFSAIIVGLKPWAKFVLKDLNGDFYLNENIDMNTVYSKYMGSLKNQLNDDGSDDQKIALIISFLKKIFTQRTVNSRVKQAVGIIASTQGKIKIEALSKEVAYSKRQLNRLFKIQVGVSPKEMAKMYSVQHSISIMKKETLPMVDVAYDAGFFDQTHFIKTFKSLCGITPDTFKKIKPTELSGLAFKNVNVNSTSLYM
ncbi:MAG: hypothetical protein COB60_01640 [Flavobacteriaceae bacterium]|nr:MAG: hypothetical protein COB60_01640 [Flavobacteriaceae bacterium]